MTKVRAEHSIHAARIERAKELSVRYSFATEILAFYQHVAIFQKQFLAAINAAPHPRTTAIGKAGFRGQLDGSLLMPHVPEFLSMVMARAPQPLAESARDFSRKSREFWQASFEDYWNQAGEANVGGNAFDQFLPRAFLQPYIELKAARAVAAPSPTISCICPLCGSRPLLGVLHPEGDGGKRFLVCSFCSHEWVFRRILCPWCGQEAEDKLPVYVAEEFPHIKVESCESCKCYVRTIDLTKDGHAIPIVDDLAAIPLSLWAEQQGFSRPEPNLLGT